MKITLELAKSSLIGISEVLVLRYSFISPADQIGQGTHFFSDMTVFSMILTHETSLLEPSTHFWASRYEIVYILYMTTQDFFKWVKKNLQQPIERGEWKLLVRSGSASYRAEI